MRSALPLALALACGACSSTTTPYTSDAGDDAPPADTGTDTGTDGGTDTGTDALTDAAPDVTRDVAPVDIAPVDVAPVDVAPVDVAPVDVAPVDAPDAALTCTMVPLPPPPPAPACAGLCGNGHRDMCSSCHPCGPRGGGGGGGPPPFPDGGLCCTTAGEDCDGTDLGGATCASIGYAGGTLHCGSWCAFDSGTCVSCTTGPHVTACDRADGDATGAMSLALAVTETEVAVAWASGTGARFARFGADFPRHGETGCFGPADARRVALAAVPTGWIAAVENAAGTGIYVVSATGAATGPVAMFPSAQMPLLAGRPGAGPLLVWTLAATGAEQESVLGADGRPTTATVTLFTPVTEPEYGSAVSAGDGFLVAMRSSVGVQVLRVGADGRAGTPAGLGAETEYPQVTWTGTEGRITWSDFGVSPPSVKWARLDATGRMIGSAVTLGGIPTYYNPSPTAAFGDHTMVLLGGYTGGTGQARRLDATVLAADGGVIVPAFHVDQDPHAVISYRLAARSGDAVAAWLTTDYPGRVGLARVVP